MKLLLTELSCSLQEKSCDIIDPRKKMSLKPEDNKSRNFKTADVSNLCFEHDLYHVKKIKIEVDDCKASNF